MQLTLRSPVSLSDLGLVAIAAAWGSTYLCAKTALASFPVALLLLLRFALAAAALAPLAKLRPAAAAAGATAARWPAVLLGLLLAASLLLETAGIASTTPANAGVLIATSIVLVPLLEGWLDRRGGLVASLVPAGLSLVGCVLMSLSSDLHLNPGDLLILAAATTRALHMVAMRKLGRRTTQNATTLSFLQFGTTAAAAAAVAAWRGDLRLVTLAAAPAEAWMVVLYLALVCTVLAFVGMQKALTRTSASRAGLLLGTEPVWAAVIAVGLGGTVLGLRQWIGAVLVVAAAEWGRRALTASPSSP